MDWTEVVFSGLAIAAAIWLSDVVVRGVEPKADYIDRDSPWLDRLERPTRSRK